MAGVNKVIVVGRLGNDPDLRYMQNGDPVCRLSIATDRTWINKQTDEKVTETEWHRVTVWGKNADNCDKYLSKGRQVYIEGRLRTSSYEKEGVKHYSTEIIAEQVQFLGDRQDDSGSERREHSKESSKKSDSGGSGSDNWSKTGRNTPVDDDDDIPF